MPTLTLSKASGAHAQAPSADEQVRKSSRIGTRKESEMPAPAAEDVAVMGRKLVDRLLAARDVRDGELLSEPFMHLPSRRQYPDYYVVIRRPITLSEVRTKLKQKEYPTWTDLKQDLELICTNAKRFNMRDSDIWLKARDLHSMIKDLSTSVYDEWLASHSDAGTPHPAPTDAARDSPAPARSHKITLRAPRTTTEPVKVKTASPEPTKAAATTPAEPSTPATPATPATASPSIARMGPSTSRPLMSPSVPTPTTASYVVEPRRRGAPRGKRLKVMLRWLVQSLMALQDSDGHLHVDMFMELPSRDEYPDYYQFVQQPISLAEIERKLDGKKYINPYALVSDVRLMLSNAKFYNEEGSLVWNDADALQKHLERSLIPALLAEGFTLDPHDHRQAALPPGTPGAVPPPPPSAITTPSPVPKPPIARVTSAAAVGAAPSPAPPPAAAPVPVAPVPVPPPPPTLERIAKDMSARVWPPSLAAWVAPAACQVEAVAPPAPTSPSPCVVVKVRVHLPHTTCEVQLGVDHVQRHALRLPQGAMTTEWRFCPRDTAVGEGPPPRFCVDQQALHVQWHDDEGWLVAWDVQPGMHTLEAQWPSEWDAAPLRIYLGT